MVSVFILAFSVGSLLYWARLACRNILRARPRTEEIEVVAAANRLAFQRVRQQIEAGGDASSYDGLRDVLRHDFLALTYLLRYAATVNVGSYSSDERLLVADFHFMRLVYRLTRALFPRTARFALLEMESILAYFAAVMNRRMVTFSARMAQA